MMTLFVHIYSLDSEPLNKPTTTKKGQLYY